jgi:hypothetical protein
MTAETGEAVHQPDVLAAYRAIDTNLPVGSLSVAEYTQLREDAGDPELLGPGARYDRAWAGLEATLAMRRGDINPATEAPYTPKERNIASDAVRAEFRALARDESAPPLIRAQAIAAGAGVATYQEITQEKARPGAVGKNHVIYLRGIQAAGRLLLEQPEVTEAEAHFMNALTTMAIMTEYGLELSWYLPASPRQPWQVNGYLRDRGAMARVVIQDEPPEDNVHNVVTIQRNALGDELWQEDESFVQFETLRNYTRTQPGVGARRGKPTIASVLFNGIADRHVHYLSEQAPHSIDATNAALGAIAARAELAGTPEPEAELHTELRWYAAQSAYDLRDIVPSTFSINLANLQAAHAAGELSPGEQRGLGWMQLDHAQILVMQSRQATKDAEQARTTAARGSRFDAPAHEERASAEEAKAAAYMEQAKARFDEARETILAVTKDPDMQKSPELYGILLDAEAMPVYKALFTGAGAEELTKIVAGYTRRIAALYMNMRDAARRFKNDEASQLAVETAVLRANLCLLLSASSEEAEGHLVLPTSLRQGGARGEMDAVAYMIDYMEGGYDAETPVTIQVEVGSDLVVERRHVQVGIDLLMLKDDSFAMMSKLAAVLRKKGSKKPEARSPEIDAVTTRIADAVADASEM